MSARLTHPLAGYAFAAASVACVYVLRRALDPLIGVETPFVVLFFLPVMVSAWLAGLGPALTAAVLAVWVGDTISFNPARDLPLAARITRVLTFLLESALLSALIESRRRSVASLAQSEQRYRVLTENFPNGSVLLFDRELRYLVAGGQSLAEVGLAPHHFIGKTPSEMFPEVAHILEPLYRGALAGHAHIKEVHWAEHDYQTYHVPVRDRDGAIIGGMVMTQDITRAKKLERELRQAQKMDAVGRLAGGVAHDFNNLLMVILGRVEMLSLGPIDEQALKQDLRAIGDAAERAAELTRQLLTFGRQQVLETEALDVNALVRELEATLCNLVGERIALQLALSDRPALALLNRGQFEQVLMNLCVNARDAISGRGAIMLRTSSRQLDEASGQEQGVPAGQYVCIEVIDSGHGMDALTREHLFEPYFTTKGRSKGSGLGLSIVHGIVGQHHGHITVRSTPGQGSEFAIYLPPADGATHSAEVAQVGVPAAPRRGRGELVLVVEDEPDVRKMLAEFLVNAGYRVLVASSAEEALELTRADPRIDLMVTDMVLPQMTGYELCRVLASAHPHIRSLLMSGYSEQLVGLSHLTATGTLFLAKPFTMSELLARLETLLATRGSGAAQRESSPQR